MLGFHQATSDNARQLTPAVVEKPRYGSFPIDGFAPVTDRRVPTHLFYRTGRSGTPDRACDVGAPAGTAVLAPVSGTVMELKHYSLYKVTPDVEVHIQPDGVDGLEVVMIHVDGLAVHEGQRVEAGLTRIGQVRRLSNILTTMQLSYYTHEAGDHVHVQVNVPSTAPGPHAGD
jgi:murein DD-endopeptidase MepM/ murein hydrolase activator NlpD